jgi:hypothetical protein
LHPHTLLWRQPKGGTPIDRQGKQTQDKLSFSQLGTNCDAMNGVKKKRQTV